MYYTDTVPEMKYSASLLKAQMLVCPILSHPSPCASILFIYWKAVFIPCVVSVPAHNCSEVIRLTRLLLYFYSCLATVRFLRAAEGKE